MESFLVAVNAVVPFLCYITFGYVMEIKGVVKEDFLQQLNKMVFKVFYPFMTFYNIYKADASSLPRPVMLIFCGVSILVLEVILVLTVPRLVKENPRRGVIIQAIYRSNFVLFGLPLTVSVFGDVASSVAAMVVTVVITIYNTTSVVILEMFNSEGKTDVKTILVNVVKNPLLQGAMVGLVFFFLGIHVPKSLLTPIAAFADATSPVALFVLGGTLHFNAIRGNLKYLVPALSLKLSEIELVKRTVKDYPVLLLDDVLSELDGKRQEHLLSEISHIQTLITCTGLDEFVNSRFQMDKIFKIVEGTVESEELCVQL